jgi:hypothetical protein
VRALRDGKVHPDPPSVNLLVAHALLGGPGVLGRLKVDEGEASGATGLKKRKMGFVKRPQRYQTMYRDIEMYGQW